VSAVLALRGAQKAGARVFVRDGRLVVQSQGQLPDDVLADLQQHRDRLVEILLTPAEEQPPPICAPCGRPQHEADYVCPAPSPHDPHYPVAAGWPGLEAACAAIRAAEIAEPMAEAA
jgi:hypothetical protein